MLVYLCCQGKMDMIGLMHSVTRRDFMRFQMYMAELVNRDIRLERERTGNVHGYLTMIGGGSFTIKIDY